MRRAKALKRGKEKEMRRSKALKRGKEKEMRRSKALCRALLTVPCTCKCKSSHNTL